MSAVGFVGNDGIQGAGGEERVEPVRVEQGRLVEVFLVELGDAAPYEASEDLFAFFSVR